MVELRDLSELPQLGCCTRGLPSGPNTSPVRTENQLAVKLVL